MRPAVDAIINVNVNICKCFCEFKATCPASQIVPLLKGSPIDGQPEFDSIFSAAERFPPQLQVGVLGVLQVGEHLLHQPGKVFPIDKVVCLHENLPGKMLACYSTMSTCYSTNCVAQCQPHLSRDSPIGLYFALNLSNRWKVFRSCK